MELSELAWPVKGLEVSLEQAREESHTEKKRCWTGRTHKDPWIGIVVGLSC